MKKLGLMSIILIVLIGLAACGNKKEIEPDLPRAIPDEYLGTYYDAIAGRGSLEVSPVAMVMDWSNSAYEHDTTTFLTDYDEGNKRINYTGATLIRSTYTSETEHTDETIYDDGTGYFEIKDEKLIWHDDKAEGEPIEFLRNMANVINPWTYTQDLSEAIAASVSNLIRRFPYRKDMLSKLTVGVSMGSLKPNTKVIRQKWSSVSPTSIKISNCPVIITVIPRTGAKISKA
ncbi:MAG: hypothetical protein IJI66_14945 [Erysipelotrichaceae bacterium]|nr:hypothetical protein [Erysipelotrichaceae bacterium]